MLEVRGICLREKFESTVKIGDWVFCKLEKDKKVKFGEYIAIHCSDTDELAGRVAAEHGGVNMLFLRMGCFVCTILELQCKRLCIVVVGGTYNYH